MTSAFPRPWATRVLSFLALILSGCHHAPTPAPPRIVGADNPAFLYQGRFDRSDPAAPVIIWESSRVSIDFDGPFLALNFGHAGWQDYFDVQVDGERCVIGVDAGEKETIPWPGKLGSGPHHLVLSKRSEASAGSVAFRGIEIAGGADADRPLIVQNPVNMLFFGDSITAGACDEDGASDQWESRRTHNANLAYPALTAHAFGADFQNISVSGIGIAAGYVEVTFGDIWDRLYPVKGSAKADLSLFTPDVVFFNFGNNDASYPASKGQPFPATFVDRYIAVLSQVRTAFPDAEFVILRGGMSDDANNPTLIAKWNEVVRRFEARDPRTTHFVITHWTDLHPRVADHRMMADELIQWLKGQRFGATGRH